MSTRLTFLVFGATLLVTLLPSPNLGGAARPPETRPVTGPIVYNDMAVPTGCTVTHAWEDGSKIAACDDGTEVVYDPDGQFVPGVPCNPVREPGWYPRKVEVACATPD